MNYTFILTERLRTLWKDKVYVYSRGLFYVTLLISDLREPDYTVLECCGLGIDYSVIP